MIETACVACGKSHRVKSEMAGRKARCTCGAVFAIKSVVTSTEPLPPIAMAEAKASVVPPRSTLPAPAVQPQTISRQVREWSWVLAGIGWLLFAMCCILALTSIGSAMDGTFAKLKPDQRLVFIVSVIALNGVAVLLVVHLGNAKRLAALFPTAAAGAILPGTLGSRFRRFGNLQGRTRAEITTAVGRPFSISQMGASTLVQWAEGGYLLAAMFDGAGDDAKCQGISSEIGV